MDSPPATSLASTTAMLRSTTLLAYIAGLATAMLIALAVSYREAVVQIVRRFQAGFGMALSPTMMGYLAGVGTTVWVVVLMAHGGRVIRGGRTVGERVVRGLVDVWRGKGMVVVEGEVEVKVVMAEEAVEAMTDREEREVRQVDAPTEVDGEAEGAKLGMNVEVAQKGKEREVAMPKNPFKFRKRLWYEPPEDLDIYKGGIDDSYEWKFGHYDAVQKKFKEAGGKDLEWKTNWLDLTTELCLLLDYGYWMDEQAKNKKGEHEAAFYQELSADLNIEYWEVFSDRNKNDERFGRSRNNADELWEVMDEVEDEARAK